MQIKDIVLKNFRSYRDQTMIVGLSNVNIFIGPNNAGKSNILEALKYLKELLNEKPTRAFIDMPFDYDRNSETGISITVSFGSKQREEMIDFLFTGNHEVPSDRIKKTNFLSDLTYSVRIRNKGVVGEDIKTSNLEDGELEIMKSRLLSSGSVDLFGTNLVKNCKSLSKFENLILSEEKRINYSPRFGILLLHNALSPSTEKKIIEYLREIIGKIEWFEPNRGFASRMSPSEDNALNPTGENLVRFMNSIQGRDPPEFSKYEHNVMEIFPTITAVLATLRGTEATLNIKEIGLNSRIDSRNFGVGTNQAFILSIGIIAKKFGSIILIEEPELHLHPTSQRRLFRLIQREALENQKLFFLTTHSTIFTACNQNNNTYLVTKKKGATNLRKIEAPGELREIKNVLGHRNTNLYGDECVVFIEGDSEEVAFPIITEAMDYDLVEKGIRLINFKGSGKGKKLEQYLGYLDDTDVLSYVIADKDKEFEKKIKDWISRKILPKEHVTIWKMEFEDCFSTKLLSEAIEEYSKEKIIDFEISVEKFDKTKSETRPVVNLIQKELSEKTLPNLDKPLLSEILARLLAKEIKENTQREKTPPEVAIENIIQLVESRMNRQIEA